MRGDFGDSYGGYSGGDYSDSGGKPWNDEYSRSPASTARADERSGRQDTFERWIETVEFLPSESVVTRLGGSATSDIQAFTALAPAFSHEQPAVKSETGQVLASASAPLTFGLTPHPEDFTNEQLPKSVRQLRDKRLGAVMTMALLAAMGVGAFVQPWTIVEGRVAFSGNKDFAAQPAVAELAIHLLPSGITPGFLADSAARTRLVATGINQNSALTLRLTRTNANQLGDDQARLTALLTAARDASGAGWAPDTEINRLTIERARLTSQLVDAWLKVAQVLNEPTILSVGTDAPPTDTATPTDPTATSAPLPERTVYLQAIAARDAIAQKLSTLGGNDEAKKALDDAAARFEKALAAVNDNQKSDPALAAFAKAAADIQTQTQQLTDDLLERRLEQVTRLEQLKRRLTDRMKVRQEKAWAADTQLAQLCDQLSTVERRRTAAEESGAVNAASELTGEKQYLQSMIESRKSVLGTDPGDTRAVTEVQSLIDEATAGAEADKAAANQRLAAQRQKLNGMLAGTQDESRRKQAAELQQRLDEVAVARQAYAKTQETKTSAAGTASDHEREQLRQQLAQAQQKVDAFNGQVLAHLVAIGIDRFTPGSTAPSVAEVPPVLKATGKAVAAAAMTATAESKDIVSRWVAMGKEITDRKSREGRQVVPPAVAIVGRVDPRQSWAMAAFALVLGLGRLLFASRTEKAAEQPIEAVTDDVYNA